MHVLDYCKARAICITHGMSCLCIMMTSPTGNIFRLDGPLCGKFTSHRWIPLTKASDAEHCFFLWSAPRQTVEWTIETPVICDAIALIITSLWRYQYMSMFLPAVKSMAGLAAVFNVPDYEVRHYFNIVVHMLEKEGGITGLRVRVVCHVSLAPGIIECNFRWVVFKLILMTGLLGYHFHTDGH